MDKKTEIKDADIVSVFYVSFNMITSLVLIYCAIYDMFTYYILALSASSILSFYLLFSWKMTPNAHNCIYLFVFTDYDKEKRKIYEEKMYNIINSLTEVKYSAASYGLSMILPTFFSFISRNFTLFFITFAALALFNVANIIMSYKHLKHDR